jgi:3-methyladenine DNA glycosylase AlkD
MRKEDVIARLKALSNPGVVEEMARFGINPGKSYGVSTPNLWALAREIGIDHGLAQELWASGIHDARLVAGLIADPKATTGEQMDSWARDFDSWAVCDHCCNQLFARTRYAHDKVVEWSGSDQEYVKRAGFVMMASLVVKDRKAADERFEAFFPLMVREAGDERNYVKRALNTALRTVGKRSSNLNRKAVETAREIGELDSKSARWIASDAIRELTSDSVQKRLQRKK